MTACDGLKLAVYSQKYRKAKIHKVISAFVLIFELMCCSLDGLYAEQLKLGQTGCRQRFMVYAKAIVSVE